MIVRKGIIRNGQVIVEEPINLPDGSEVTITGRPHGRFLGEEDNDRPPTPQEIAAALAAMAKVEPFDMTDEERAEAETWEKKVKDYTIANMDKGADIGEHHGDHDGQRPVRGAGVNGGELGGLRMRQGCARHPEITMRSRSTCWFAFLMLALARAGSSVAAAEPQPTARPNVVLFVADDHGQDAGCYGNRVIRTPHIDQLAREGTLYRYAFCTTASCSASRSVILSGLHNHLTGQYGHAHSYHHFISFGSLQTLPVILARNGYHTARIGKYHVAPEEVYHFQTVLPSVQGNRNPVRMAENCREFIADKSKPFFLYFCTSDPHRGGGPRKDKPHQPDAFGNNVAHPGVQEIVYDPKDVIVPLWMPDTPAARAELAEYYRSVSRVDQGLGRLVQLLKDAGQYENTLFLYTSDNGIAMPGSKTTLYEPGMRLPLIVRAPDVKRRGLVSEAMISWVDFTPTILDYASVNEVLAPPLIQGEPEQGARNGRQGGKELPKVKYTFHGRSFRPTLEQEKPAGWNEVYGSHTFHEITMYYPMRVIRTERYKLILNIAHQLPFPFASDLYQSATWQSVKADPEQTRYGKRRITDFVHRPRYELYDLQTDPDEVVNRVDDPKYAEIFQELAQKLKAFQKRTRDPWFLKYAYE